MTLVAKKRTADASTGAEDPFAAMAAVAEQAGDKRFLGQLHATKAAADQENWHGVTLGLRMLYRIAGEGNYLDKIESILRPLFDSARAKFEESRRTARALRARMRTAARKMKQLSRLASVLRGVAA